MPPLLNREVFVDPRGGFAIASAPKVGTLSIIHLLFELRSGFKPAKGEATHEWIKNTQMWRPLHEVLARGIPIIAIHRDPFERIRSAYEHRVVREREAASSSFRDFCENLAQYRRIPSIAWHTDPQVEWLGRSAGIYAAHLGIRDLSHLPMLLRAITGRAMPEIEWKHRMEHKPDWEPGLKEILTPWVRADLEAGWNGQTPAEVLKPLNPAPGDLSSGNSGAAMEKSAALIDLGRYQALSEWGWYRKFAKDWQQWLGTTQPARVLEIGAFDGVSANVMLDEIFTHPDSTVDTIDPYLPDPTTPKVSAATREVFEENRHRGGHQDRIRLHHGTARDVLARMWLDGLGQSFDVVYIDGGHTSPDVLSDAVMAWPLLKPGGTMVFDDFKWGEDRPPTLRPREAVLAFESAFARELIPLHRGYQRIYRKAGIPGGLKNRAGESYDGRVVIVGGYNSGSSLLSLMMECLGFDLARPTWEDFGESAALRRILISAFDEKRVVRTMERGKMIEKLRQWLKHVTPHAGVLCLKHPLCGMFLPEITEAFGEGTRFLRILRPLDVSIRKLAAREWFPDPERLQRLLNYQTEIYFQKCPPTASLTFSDLLADPRGKIRQISSELDFHCEENLIERAVRLIRQEV